MTRSRSATPALLCVRFLSPLGRSAARSLRQEEIGRKFGILPVEKALVARLSASATAHRLVAQESMHCSGRYSGTGVQVFSALPVVQQRAQVDIGQKSGILQMKHAPTALTCHGGPRRSSTICGVEGVAKPGSAPVASRILRYQPYTGLDPLLPRIRAARAIPALPPISCEDGTHLCPACPCPSTHAPPPNHGPRAAFQSPQFCA